MVFLVDIQDNTSLNIFLSIVGILVTITLVYLIYRSVRKEQKRYHEEVANYIEGVESKQEIMAEVNAYISRSVAVEFSLLLVDMDKFSSVIDTFGKEESRRIIKGLANKLLGILPSRVSMGFMQDDRFVIFLRGDYSREDSIRLAKKVVETIAIPTKVYDESTISLTCSVGIAHFPVHGRNFKQLYESLDIVTYVCKRNGGNQYRIYSKDEEVDQTANMEYYYQIKSAIKNKEFDIYFQPMINDTDKSLFGFEGLLRWNHPELGVLSPFKFINIMEQTGDINWVGQWGLETVIKYYLEIHKQFPNLNIIMSLNLSPKQLTNPSLASDFQKIIKKYRIPSKTIVLEVAEFSIFEKQEQIQENINRLNEIGFLVAVDGFGLDYKALKKLEEMSIDIVKLDKEYLDPESDQYLKTKFIDILVNFANTNSKKIICEGIENFTYLERAREMKLDCFQGYYFAKPMSFDDTKLYIEAHNWKTLLEAKASYKFEGYEPIPESDEDSSGKEEVKIDKEDTTDGSDTPKD